MNSDWNFLPGTSLYPKLGVEAMELIDASNVNRKIHEKNPSRLNKAGKLKIKKTEAQQHLSRK